MPKRNIPDGEPIRVGVVGVGDQGMGFLHALKVASQFFEVVGVSDISLDNLNNASKNYNVEKTTTDWRELLEDDSIDLMYFGTPGGLHSENLLETLSNDKHVYIEKPVAINTDDCRKAIKIAEEHNLTVMVCMNVRYYWPNPIIKEIIDKGILGDVFFAQQDYIHDCRYKLMPDSKKFVKTYKQPINYFYEAGIHSLDTLMWLLGPIKRIVSAHQSKGIISQLHPNSLYPNDCISIEFEFEKTNLIGRSVTLIGYVGYYGNQYYGLSLYGNKGTALPMGVFTTEDNPEYEQAHNPDTWCKREYKELYEKYNITSDHTIVPYNYVPGHPSHVSCHLKLFKFLIPAIREGREVEPGLRSNAMVIAVLEAAMKALETGISQEVDYNGLR